MTKKPTAFENPVFHAGPRSCLGQNMARMEIAVAIKWLMGRYSLEKAWEGEERFLDEGITSPMAGGLPVKLRKR